PEHAVNDNPDRDRDQDHRDSDKNRVAVGFFYFLKGGNVVVFQLVGHLCFSSPYEDAKLADLLPEAAARILACDSSSCWPLRSPGRRFPLRTRVTSTSTTPTPTSRCPSTRRAPSG